jgi:hypothetical protein
VAILELPIRSDLSAYSFQLELEGVLFNFYFYYNQRMDRWFMDIKEQDDTPVIMGIPMLYGSDLIGRFVMDGRPLGRMGVWDESGKEQNATQFIFGQPVLLLYEESTDAAV